MPKFIRVSKDSASSFMKRRDVTKGMIFVVKGKDTPYAAMGQRTIPPSNDNRWMSLNLVNGEESSTDNGDSTVQVIGTYVIDITLGDGFSKYQSKISV